jgi:plasmid maintenance system antidote protein VapI
MDIEKNVTERVRVIIDAEIEKGVKQTAIAPKLGLPSQAVTHLLNGTQKKPSAALIMQIINKMKVDPMWLAGEIGNKQEIIYQKA